LRKKLLGVLFVAVLTASVFLTPGVANACEIPAGNPGGSGANSNMHFYLSTHNAHPGTKVRITSSGFTPNGKVSYNFGNSTTAPQAPIEAQADESGRVHDFTVTIPESATGVLLFVAVDFQTNTHRFNSVQVLVPAASVVKNLSDTNTTYFTGKDFAFNSTVSIEADGQVLGYCNTGEAGDLAVGCGANLNGAAAVALKDTKGGVVNVRTSGAALFSAPLTSSQTQTHTNKTVHIGEDGFRPGTLVDVYLNGVPFQTYLAHAETGRVSFDLNIPEAFFSGPLSVNLRDQHTGQGGTKVLKLNKPVALTAAPSYSAGDEVTILASGFNPDKKATFYNADGSVVTAKLTEKGTFQKKFKLPKDTKPGTYNITVQDSSHGAATAVATVVVK
jgi:hypothetical protein